LPDSLLLASEAGAEVSERAARAEADGGDAPGLDSGGFVVVIYDGIVIHDGCRCQHPPSPNP